MRCCCVPSWLDGLGYLRRMGCGAPNTPGQQATISEGPASGSADGAGAANKKVIASWPCEVRFLFIRHAQAQPGRERVGPEKKDPRLSDTGEEQARKLAGRLQRDWGGGLEVVCSPMARCIRTALPLTQGRNIIAGRRRVCHALLCEHGNDPKDFFSRNIADTYPELFGSTGFEPAREVSFVGFDSTEVETRQRATSIAKWLCAECSRRPQWQEVPVAVFCHQTFLDCLMQIIVDGDASQWAYGSTRFSFQNTGITEVVVSPQGVNMCKNNDWLHLR
mmetsp:Transcript_139729/g.260619  ORF Transcript_139729/g.260619 Transcript_139729/m.260619 type:complete len:277 (-) Transcript_139729:14-844(-)